MPNRFVWEPGDLEVVSMPRPLRKEVTGKVKTTVEIPAALWERAKIRAIKDRTDFRSVVVAALRAYLERGR